MTEDANTPETETLEQGQPEGLEVQGSESSPDSGENHEQKHDSVQARINKITAEKYAAKREAEELKKQLEEAQKAKVDAPSAPPVQSGLSDAPKLPDDIYDEEAMRKYHADTLAYNRKVAEDAGKSQYKKQLEEQKKAQEQATQKQAVDGWIGNAQKGGIDLDKLGVAEQTIANAGVKPELAQHIMSDPNGPAIAVHLAENPALMYEVLNMSPMQAAVKIETQIKADALSKTPKVSNAPEPLPEINGGGMVEQDEFSRQFPDAKII